MIRVLIYNEYQHEKIEENVRKIYPEGIHNCLKASLAENEIIIDTVTLDDVETITEERLSNTDVLIWWGHMRHHLVPDEVAYCVRDAVHKGMGLIVLHSGHYSKPFKLLMGTPCNLTWRENGDHELIWVVNPNHPIAQGIGRFIYLEHEETYGEPFGIPEPDELVFIGSYEGGEVFRSGCCYQRGGRIFYFQPGHETYKSFYNKDVIRVIKNAIHWAAPICRLEKLEAPQVKKPLED